ncbi:uncharacterized protein LOC111876014 [Lactuca sativa]|uniref:Uncharacterized protein n=1 Tax=Lactuca sativa TaxID=4236 RepID=A0A9R1W5Z8_LACSA|nr:uncharacterized protein LOC111876014 [Lactuca sativa]KAJ0219005.1 hypothetical protein LSAT_V11C300156370 [Lactuca sativa]
MDPIITYSSSSFKIPLSSFCYPFTSIKSNTTFKKPRRNASYISLSSNSENPTSVWQKYSSSIKKLPTLRSILHGLRTFDKTSMNQWCSNREPISDRLGCNYLQNGGLGMALLSVTSTAKVRISPFVATLAANPTFVSAFFAWLIAQSLKVLLHFCFEKKLDLRIMCSSGGMPSSHSALCTALTTSVAICHGVADSLFPVCLGFSLIVMYDAIGVRRHAGMQAEVLNLIVEDLFQGHPVSKRKLKELLGHTPSQVVAGAVLGILVASICCQGCFHVI